jgi:hypothetical protein
MHTSFYSESLKGKDRLGNHYRGNNNIKADLTETGLRLWTGFICFGFEVLLTVTMKSYIFRDVTPCSSVEVY